MLRIIKFAIAKELNALIVLSASLLLSLIIEPVAILSAALLVFLFLTQEPKKCGLFLAYSFILLLVASFLIFSKVWLGPARGAAYIIPSVIICWSYVFSKNFSFSLAAGAVTALVGYLILALLVGDPVQWWLEIMRSLEIPSRLEQIGINESEISMQTVASYTVVFAVIYLMFCWQAAFLLARWWQSNIFSNFSFGQEFRSLDFGNKLGALVLLLVAYWYFVNSAENIHLSMVASVLLGLYFLQGLALVHFFVNHKQLSRIWLIVFYILIAIFLNLIFLVSLIGLLESFLRFRKKLATD